MKYMYQYIIVVLLIIVIIACSIITQHSLINHNSKLQINDSLENELLLLKNQAFCNCYFGALKEENAHVNPLDGTSYLQLSDLAVKYTNDVNLRRIINVWINKEYISYLDSNKLYIMRCLDFYNSKDLEQFIDSVRNIEQTNKR
jgi:hypothetical protein